MPIFTFAPPPPTSAAALTTADAVSELVHGTEVGNYRRDRLLSAMVLLLAISVLLGAPFALQAGAAFFLPVVTAIVIAVILVPLVEWFRRRRIPPGGAAALAVLGFLAAANLVVVSIIVPALAWLQTLPAQITQIRHNLRPLMKTYAVLEHFVHQSNHILGGKDQLGSVASGVPTAVFGFVTSAPLALLTMLFTLLLTFFFLTLYAEKREAVETDMARARRVFDVARLGRDIVRNTAAYFFTIATVNLILGAALTLVAWGFGLPSPLMWGGIAALFNFVPYVGPLTVICLLLIAGLVTFSAPINALWPALCFLGFHLSEANLITPRLVGRRLTMNPLAILIALSFWGWVWGLVGALISVPLLIMGKVLVEHVGKPNVMGFLFRDGTLVTERGDSPADLDDVSVAPIAPEDPAVPDGPVVHA